MPVYQGVEYRERHVDPKSPRFALTPGSPHGESRLEANYWFQWDDLCVTPPTLSATDVGGVTPARAPAAFLGYGLFVLWPIGGSRFVSHSPEMFAGFTNIPGGRLPFSHPDFPPGFFLADTLQATGDVPQGMTARSTANYDEGNCVVGFKRPPGGYRALSDTTVLVPPGAANPNPPFGDGLPLPGVGTLFSGPVLGGGPPFEGYCCRFMEVRESMGVVAQSLPPSGPGGGGLVWIESAPIGPFGARPAATVGTYIPLFSSEITVQWYPVPVAYWQVVEPKFQNLVGKTNANPFPPTPPPGCPPSRMTRRPRETLVMGQHNLEWIQMGNCDEALKVTLRMKYHPHGANHFFRWDRPTAEGGPGYARVAQPPPPGLPLFPLEDYAAAFYAN